MKQKILMICVWLFAGATAFASIDMNEVYEWLCFPLGQKWVDNYMNRHGCSKEEIVDALLTFAEHPEWSEKRDSNGFRRSLAIISLEEIGSTNDLPRIIPLVMDDHLPVHHAAISAYVKITAKSDPDRMFEFADYLLQLPLPSEDLKRHAFVLTCFRWLLAEPTTSPEVKDGIMDYFRRTRFHNQFCAFETDWFFAESIPEYGGSDERRNLVALWAASTNIRPGLRNYFVGVQRQFFPMDAPPPDETAPASLQDPPPGAVEEAPNPERDRQDVQDPLPDTVEEAAPPAAATVLSPVPDLAAETPQTHRSSHGPWWIAVLVLAAVSGVVLKMRHR